MTFPNSRQNTVAGSTGAGSTNAGSTCGGINSAGSTNGRTDGVGRQSLFCGQVFLSVSNSSINDKAKVNPVVFGLVSV